MSNRRPLRGRFARRALAAAAAGALITGLAPGLTGVAMAGTTATPGIVANTNGVRITMSGTAHDHTAASTAGTLQGVLIANFADVNTPANGGNATYTATTITAPSSSTVVATFDLAPAGQAPAAPGSYTFTVCDQSGKCPSDVSGQGTDDRATVLVAPAKPITVDPTQLTHWGSTSGGTLSVSGSFFTSGDFVTFARNGVKASGFSYPAPSGGSATTLTGSASLITGLFGVAVANPAQQTPYDIVVQDPAGVGAPVTCSGCLVVDPLPTITGSYSVGKGAQGVTINVFGTNFLQLGSTPPSVSFVDEQAVPSPTTSSDVMATAVKYVSPTEIQVTVNAPDPNNHTTQMFVTNPDHGTSAGAAFTFIPPPAFYASPGAPNVGASTSVGPLGQNAFRVSLGTIELTGDERGFTIDAGAGITIDQSAEVVTAKTDSFSVPPGAAYDEVTGVVATVTPTAATGARDVTVTNPDGGTAVCSGCLTVDAGPAITTLSMTGEGVPSGAPVARSETVHGTNFNPGTGNSGGGATLSIGTLNADGSFTDDSSQFDFPNGQTMNTGGSSPNPSATSITLPIGVKSTTPVGVYDVRLINANDNGRAVCVGCFTVGSFDAGTSVAPTLHLNTDDTTSGTSFTVSGGGNIPTDATLELVPQGIPGQPTIVDQTCGGTTGHDCVNTARTSYTGLIVLTDASPGNYSAVLISPTAGTSVCLTSGGTDCTVQIGATDPNPHIMSIAPDAAGQGANNFAIKLTGDPAHPFYRGDKISFTNSGVSVVSSTWVSETEIDAVINITASAATGPTSVVDQHAGGTGPSTATPASFTVDAAPTFTSATPGAIGQGGTKDVDIKGTNFASGVKLEICAANAGISGAAHSGASATEFVATLTVPVSQAAGACDLSVINPDGGTAFKAGGFTIDPKPTVSSVTPSRVNAGRQNQQLVIQGSGFQSGSTASFPSTSGIHVVGTPSASSDGTSLTVTIDVDTTAPRQAEALTVVNGDGGEDSSSTLTVTTPTAPHISVAPTVVGGGAGRHTISGVADPNTAVTILARRADASALSSIGTVVTDSSGRFSLTRAPFYTTVYQGYVGQTAGNAVTGSVRVIVTDAHYVRESGCVLVLYGHASPFVIGARASLWAIAANGQRVFVQSGVVRRSGAVNYFQVGHRFSVCGVYRVFAVITGTNSAGRVLALTGNSGSFVLRAS